ncbi:V-type ATP synthase subunit I [Acetivibrio clariflavus]|uniref:V-type ATP synthase subunit I n=1 Tax=Acetivibrio clariflavus TaxID=288965 RepID=UPI000482FDE0|nr:V-type ATP synthase subunit I [Acetivibrio clariflavus]
MAIVKMSKLSLIGLESDKEKILDILMNMGVVEISESLEKLSSEEWKDLVVQDGDSEKVAILDDKINKVKWAIEYLSKFSSKKKGLFSEKRCIDKNEYNMTIQNIDKLSSIVESIHKYNDQLAYLKSEKNKYANLILSLEPWQQLTIPLNVTSTLTTTILIGIVPHTSTSDRLKEDLISEAPESYFELISSDGQQNYILVIYHNSCEENILKVLKRYNFSKVVFKELEGTVKSNIDRAQKNITRIDKECEKVEKEVSEFAKYKDDLEILHDHLLIERDRVKVLDNLLKTSRVFYLEGWFPSELGEKLKTKINSQVECFLEITEPDKDEDFPILLKNKKLVQPFEAITEMYSLPSTKDVDPTFLMAPFYCFFFGMMVSDAAYGIVMALITGIILLKYKLQGTMGKMIKLLFFCGISTVAWGAMFGGWFGDILPLILGGKLNIPPIWFNPLDNPMKLLIWSMVFGGVHLFTGMGIKAYMLIKEEKIFDAIFDIGSWYILLIGVALLLVGGTPAQVGKYMAIVGAAMLVLTQGRDSKNIIKRLLSGVLSLYNITGYLSDVLSYSRLLALGLGTGVIASVINTLGTLFGLNPLGIIILIIVFIIGHTFNLAINALGAYVHTSRLQYVEFFGKFYEGGGKRFEPFKKNTKYITLNDKEAV